MNKYNDPKSIQEFIQQKLGETRKNKAITQDELASFIGISPKTLSDIENNRRGISIKTLIKICGVLKIDIKNLFNIKKND